MKLDQVVDHEEINQADTKMKDNDSESYAQQITDGIKLCVIDLLCGEGKFRIEIDTTHPSSITTLPNGDCAKTILNMEYITAANVKV